MRASEGNEPGGIFRVDRSRTQTSNYAKLNVDERIAEWNSIDFFLTNGEVDRPHKDTQIVALDDIKITGAFTNKLFRYSLHAIPTVAAPTAYSSTRSQPMIHASNSPIVA